MHCDRKIFKDFFLFIAPIYVIIHIVTWGCWTVEYLDGQGQKQVSGDLVGFPFPSRGHFWGAQFYNSGDESFSFFNAALNTFIMMLLSALLYYLFLRKLHPPKILIVAFIFPIYLIGAFALLGYFGFIGSSYEWVGDYKVISYNWWNF